MSDFVSAPPALARRLQQIGVVDTDQQGKDLAHSLKQGQRLVSREGGLWRWDGFTVSSEAVTPSAVRLEQRTRLTEVRKLLLVATDAVTKTNLIVMLHSRPNIPPERLKIQPVRPCENQISHAMQHGKS